MAGKARVHELAKELGVTSKEVLARLSDQGEFVKSASSTVEAPVARRLRESFGGAKSAAAKVKAEGNGSPAKVAAAKPAAPEKAPAPKPAPPAEPAAARAPRGRGCGRTACGPRGATGATQSDTGRDPRPEAGSDTERTQARRAHTARRQQSVLLGSAG